MVPSELTMKHLRRAVPVLGLLALAALFFSLPETPSILTCKSCSSNSPYLSLIGSGYFAGLIALSLLFPAFPGRHLARGGLTWAALLAASLTYIHYPQWCAACLICHSCNILIWTIWIVNPAQKNQPESSSFRERMCLALFAPISVIALFSCLNLTFMAYGFKTSRAFIATALKPGDALPEFTMQTANGLTIANTDALHKGMVINFISPDCPHCKEQLVILDAVARELDGKLYRFINVSPQIAPALIQRSSSTEWVEDRENNLRNLFTISGYPTLIVVGTDGKIAQAIPGVPDRLKDLLLAGLLKELKNEPPAK